MNEFHLLSDDLEFVIQVRKADLLVIKPAIVKFFFTVAPLDRSKALKHEQVAINLDSYSPVAELTGTAH